mgnify:CR=1 FL=1
MFDLEFVEVLYYILYVIAFLTAVVLVLAIRNEIVYGRRNRNEKEHTEEAPKMSLPVAMEAPSSVPEIDTEEAFKRYLFSKDIELLRNVWLTCRYGHRFPLYSAGRMEIWSPREKAWKIGYICPQCLAENRLTYVLVLTVSEDGEPMGITINPEEEIKEEEASSGEEKRKRRKKA